MANSLSYSRARSFDECPAKFEAEYESGRKGVPEPPLIIGSLVHEVADRYVKHLLDISLTSNFDQADRIAREVWDSPERDGLSLAYKDEYFDLIDKLKQSLIFEDIKAVKSCEMMVAVDSHWLKTSYSGIDAFVRGRIDRVDMDHDGNITIVDYKSGHRIDPISGSMQLALYARMAKAYWPTAQTIDIELNYLRHGIVKKARITEQDMERGKDWIESLSKSITKAREQAHWPARPGQARRGCPIFKTCPARLVTGKITPPGDEGEAVGLLERLILVTREREDINEAVKPWIDQFGAIEVNGMMLGLDPVRMREW